MLKKIGSLFFLSFIVASLLLGCNPQSEQADSWIEQLDQENDTLDVDYALYNGVIYTVDSNFRVAQAIAIRGDKIIAIGSNDKMVPYIEAAKTKLNLEGKAVIPGLIDAHAHAFGYAASLDVINLVGTESAEEIAELVAKKAEELQPGEWIQGRGWDQNDWEIKEFPSYAVLDAVAPANPVLLRRVDGHAAWANTEAMQIAGLDRNTEDPSGGEIIRDATGNPTGVLIDNAIGIVNQHIPSMSSERMVELMKIALDNFLTVGLTGVHDMGGGPGQVEMVKALIDADEFPFRLYFNYSSGLKNLDELLAAGPVNYGDYRLVIRSVKAFADGALGSRGAAMLEPYSDRPDSSGLIITDKEDLQKITEKALAAGFQVSTHAIGDKGNRVTLDAYEAALDAVGTEDARLRVEHSQILNPEDIGRFKSLGVLPSMQPTHATSDFPWAIDRVGEERALGAYAWRKLLDTGVIIPCGSDFPVEDINPFYGIYSAITRKHQDGKPEEGYYPDQVMTREEALKGFTIWAAYAGFMEDVTGSLEIGKKADLLVLDRDIMLAPELEIIKTRPMIVMVDGKIAKLNK